MGRGLRRRFGTPRPEDALPGRWMVNRFVWSLDPWHLHGWRL